MIVEKFPSIKLLTLEEKRSLLNELWSEIEEADSDPPIPDPTVVSILEERWRTYESAPSGAMTIEEFRRRIGKSEVCE